MIDNNKISKIELNLILTLAMVFSLRMSGIFMILPILSVHALSLKGSSEYLIGIAMGIYGVMQILFQLPFGFISDRIGRKPVIIIGLIISAIGSEIISITDKISMLIIGRALQGSGAIGSVLIILLLESIREQYRTQAMAIIGISFGITFTISIIIGPFLANIFGFYGLFQIITIITVLTIVLVLLKIPKIPFSSNFHKNINLINIFHDIKLILTNLELLKLNFNIFCVHTVLTLNFIAWPKVLINLGYSFNFHYKIYAIIILISILILLLYMFYLNLKNYNKKVLMISVIILFLSELIMLLMVHNPWIFLIGMQLFFIGFNLIESILPSLISKKSPPKYKGTAISIYSIGQFLGVGLGGILGGFLLEIQKIWLLFFFALLITILNIVISNKIYKPY